MKTLKYLRVVQVVNLLLIVSFVALPITPVFAETDNAVSSVEETALFNNDESVAEPSLISGENQTTTEIPKKEEAPKEELVEELEPEEDPSLAPMTETPKAGQQKITLGEVDERSGSFSYSYPFPLPLYRDMNPELSLNYNSQNESKNSITGYGFELSIPYIRRLNREGTEDMYDKNYFYSSISGELTFINGNDFGSKKEDGTYLNYKKNNDNSWTLKTKDGTIYTFGLDEFSRQDDPNDSSRIYTWYLTSIVDSNGNTIEYTYIKNSGQIYPINIEYGPYNVSLEYETTNSSIISQYSENFQVKTEQKLKFVKIYFNDNIEKNFNILYTLPETNQVSLISQITDNSIPASPKVTEFAYEQGNNNFTRDIDWDMPYYLDASNNPVGYALGSNSTFIDINNDGLLDFVTTASSSFDDDGDSSYNDNDDTVFLNTGTGFVRDPDWDMPHSGSNGLILGLNSTFADINNDGLPDFIYTTSGAFINDDQYPYNDYYRTVFLNNGHDFVRDPSWTMPFYGVNTSIALSSTTTLGDVNNDGLTDFISTGSNSNLHAVFLNDGSGFVRDLDWDMPYRDYQGIYPIILDSKSTFTDINNDGLLDFFYTGNGGSFTGTGSTYNDPFKTVYINNGHDFVRDLDWDMPYYIQTGIAKGIMLTTNSVLADVNNDSLPDFISTSSTTNSHAIFLNTGTDFVRDSNWTMPYRTSNGSPLLLSTYSIFTDVNDDGLLDFVYTNTGNNNIFVDDDDNSDYNDYDKTVYINTGTDFVRDPDWDMPYYLNDSGQAVSLGLTAYSRYTDLNKDGLTDFIITCSTMVSCSNLAFQSVEGSLFNDSDQTVFLNTSPKDIILNSITTTSGGTINISYAKKEMENLFPAGSNLPALVNVVSSISYNDLINSPATTTYTYEDGKYYYDLSTCEPDCFNYKKFAGFATTTKTDPTGNITKTYYHQGDGSNSTIGEYQDDKFKITRPYRVEEYDNNNNLYRTTIKKWNSYDLENGYKFVSLDMETTLNYDGDGDHVDTSVVNSYDYYGNLINSVNFGKVIASNDGYFTDIGTDISIEEIHYAVRNPEFTTSLMSQYLLRDQNNNKVKETRIYYDNLSLGYIDKGNITKTENWIKAGKPGNSDVYSTTQRAYNSSGLVVTDIGPRGETTFYVYDSYNLYPITITNPLSQVTHLLYDYSSGKVIEVTDPNGLIYQTTYDGLDRVIEEKIPSSDLPYSPVTKTTYFYTDTPGNISVKQTNYLDDLNSVDTYQYFDGLGRLIQERSEAETPDTFNVKDTVYDSRGLVAKQSLSYGSIGFAKTPKTTTESLYLTNTYDALGRVKTTVDSTGTTSYLYDDWKTTVTDKKGKIKNYYKDAYDNLIKVDEINGAETYVTNYEWNLNGKLTKITDALLNIRNFIYDGLGRRLVAEDLHAPGDTTFGTWMYTYDDAGNLTKLVSPRSLVVNYTYNNLNQLLTETAFGSSVSYTYGGCLNGIGKLCAVTMSPGASATYSYNGAGNLASETKTINGTTYPTSYTYDRLGNIITITYPDNALVKYTYNTAGLPEKIERKESSGVFTDVISNFDYNPMNQIITQLYPNTITTTNAYDPAKLYRLTRRLTQNSSGTKLQDLNYTYDNVGNILTLVDSSNTGTAKTVTYTYDDLHRLTSASSQSYNDIYTYNPIGNVIGGSLGSFIYQGNIGTNYANPHAATKANSTSYKYDNDGNILANGTLANTWNYKDQLTESKKGIYTSNYTYDHSGERASFTLYKRLANGTNRLMNTVIYPNDYYNIYTNPNVSLSTKKTKEIYLGNQLVATIETTLAYDQYNNIINVITPYYNHLYHLGSINTVSGSTGNLVETLDYYPYGEQRVSSGSYKSQRQYIGEMYDSDTTLAYLNARYYDGGKGKFISQDPMFWGEQNLMDPQSLNSYSYARNNPVNLSDPNGESWLSDMVQGIKNKWNNLFGNDKITQPQPQANNPKIPQTIQLPTSKNGSVDYGEYTVTSTVLRNRLDQFANDTNQNIIVTSGDRSLERNKEVGGASASRHLSGDAADIKVNGVSDEQLSYEANKSGLFNTTIYYPTVEFPGALSPHVHVDLNPAHNNTLLIYSPYMNNGSIYNVYKLLVNPLLVNN